MIISNESLVVANMSILSGRQVNWIYTIPKHLMMRVSPKKNWCPSHPQFVEAPNFMPQKGQKLTWAWTCTKHLVVFVVLTKKHVEKWPFINKGSRRNLTQTLCSYQSYADHLFKKNIDKQTSHVAVFLVVSISSLRPISSLFGQKKKSTERTALFGQWNLYS